MTPEKAARILDPETRPDEFQKYQSKKDYMDAVNEACRIAVKALRNILTGDPMTLEQMRDMGGKPYWHVGLQADSPEPHWKILDSFVARCPEDYGYGKRWIAYAYQPAHIDREAWTAEWKDHYKSGVHAGTGSVCSSCNVRNERKTHICPFCGKAMDEDGWAMLEKRLRRCME